MKIRIALLLSRKVLPASAVFAALAGLLGSSIAHAQTFNFQTIAAGTFSMGCSQGEPVCDYTNWEHLHNVTISRDFDLTTTEVTQEQWYTVMGTNPSYFKNSTNCPATYVVVSGVSMCPDRPVEEVNWNDAQAFMSALNLAAGLTCAGLPSDPSGCYRLPTDAEWEFAARGGTTTTWSWGSNGTQAPTYGWFTVNGGNTTHDVGLKAPNPNGLYDMHGNVYEWTYDRWDNQQLPDSTDPIGPATGSFRVMRGGAYASDKIYGSSYDKSAPSPTSKYAFTGFRLVRNR